MMYPRFAMRILFVVDGRSPIALNWIRYFSQSDHEVHVVSTYPCSPDLRLASLNVVPTAFGGVGESKSKTEGIEDRGLLRRLVPVGARTALRQWLGPLTLPAAARDLARLIKQIQPDLVHAMRIPYEGMLAALALGEAGKPRLLVSVWGNDFTLHARSTPRMASLTRLVMRRATALHADCQRDIRLARRWGYAENKSVAVLPGGGGVQADIFYPDKEQSNKQIGGRGEGAMVINPRGFRAYVRNDAFFRAVHLVLERMPETRFVCPAMAGEAQALNWLETFDIGHAVDLLPLQTRAEMAELFRRCQVAVSPSTHDGTPNTLLEAMACGCFPVAGDIESLREWINPRVNGLLVDPRSPSALSEAILRALRDPEMRLRAREENTRLIAERAEYKWVMGQAESFYQRVLSNQR